MIDFLRANTQLERYTPTQSGAFTKRQRFNH